MRENGGSGQEDYHRLASGGYGKAVATGGRWRLPGRLPPSGERWLRESGGYGRAVDTGERWMREDGGYGRTVATFSSLGFSD
jgi:hypothetical protein